LDGIQKAFIAIKVKCRKNIFNLNVDKEVAQKIFYQKGCVMQMPGSQAKWTI
jgi:hypothetical protein